MSGIRTSLLSCISPPKFATRFTRMCLAENWSMWAFQKRKAAKTSRSLEIHHDDQIPPYSTRHHWCTKPTARRGSLERWHKLLHLGLLDTCKQTYQEAALLSYSLNTFSLSSADTLTRFTSALIPDQRRALRAFYFRIPIHDDVWSTWPWNDAITVALVKSLPGLRVLRLDLEGSFII